jgi:hypothetical protein
MTEIASWLNVWDQIATQEYVSGSSTSATSNSLFSVPSRWGDSTSSKTSTTSSSSSSNKSSNDFWPPGGF